MKMFLRNVFYYIVGIVFLTLAKVKNVFSGYSSPKPFSISETERCIDYDIRTVDEWIYHLQRYSNATDHIVDKTILELGPGSDLGNGIYLLSKGCSKYHAFDVNDLMKNTPNEFYEHFFKRIAKINPESNIDMLQNYFNASKKGLNSKLNYIINKNFDLTSSFKEASIDIVFSQAAFEHFDDINNTIWQLTKICKPGAILIAEIDLKSHSRWIRDKDPNNIYRYSNNVYDVFRFRGIPNRFRPFQYEEVFKYNGWSNISIIPLNSIDDVTKSYSGMNKNFNDNRNRMDILSFVLCATKQ